MAIGSNKIWALDMFMKANNQDKPLSMVIAKAQNVFIINTNDGKIEIYRAASVLHLTCNNNLLHMTVDCGISRDFMAMSRGQVPLVNLILQQSSVIFFASILPLSVLV